MQLSDAAPIVNKATEAGGVAVAVIVALGVLLYVASWCLVHVYKNAAQPFMASVVEMTQAHAVAVEKAAELSRSLEPLARDIRMIHDRHAHLLTQSPPLSAARHRAGEAPQ